MPRIGCNTPIKTVRTGPGELNWPNESNKTLFESSTKLGADDSRRTDTPGLLGEIGNVAPLMTLYPVLQVLETAGEPRMSDQKIKLKKVNSFVAFETVIEVGTPQMLEGACDASFSFWYRACEESMPVVSEFSYVCAAESNSARRLHQALLGLHDWLGPNATTKTAIAYGDFCPP